MKTQDGNEGIAARQSGLKTDFDKIFI